MKKSMMLLLLLFIPTWLLAETLSISESTKIHFILPQGWQLASEPPAALLEEMAEHIGHEAEEKGYKPTEEQLLDAARKRLAANEVLIYNPQSMSFMTVDFSSLRQGEKAPSKKTIKLSATYAGQSLEQEEGVSDVKSRDKEISISGAYTSHRYDAEYRHHGEKMHFSGVVGFSDPHWFYLYFTDKRKDPQDAQRAEDFFASFRIENK